MTVKHLFQKGGSGSRMAAKDCELASRSQLRIWGGPTFERCGCDGLLLFLHSRLDSLQNRGGTRGCRPLQCFCFEEGVHCLIVAPLPIQDRPQLIPGADATLRITGTLFQQLSRE